MFVAVAMESWDIKEEAGENNCSHIIRQIPSGFKPSSSHLTGITDDPLVTTSCPQSEFLTWFIGNIKNVL